MCQNGFSNIFEKYFFSSHICATYIELTNPVRSEERRVGKELQNNCDKNTLG